MKKIIQHRLTHLVIILAAVSFGVYAYFYALPTGEAVSNTSLGSITGSLIPNPTSGVERFEVQFDSFSGIGNRNLTGWTLRNDGEIVYTYVDLILSNGDSFAVCSAMSGGCDDTWSGGPVWLNEGATFSLVDTDGATVLSRTYTQADAAADETIVEVVEVGVPVYAKNDKIMICHATNPGEYMSKGIPAGPFIKALEADRNGHHADVDDIIPSFYYDMGAGLQYYAGLNWPDQKLTLENDCQ